MKPWYKAFQTLYIIAVIGIIAGIYAILGFYSSNEMLDYSEKHSSELLTADGLITTSTFAFVGFVSLSPSSSGSSTTIRRLDWKGAWVTRYYTLLVTTILLTAISTLTIWWCPIFMLASVVISSLILMFIIVKYSFFHISAEKKAAKKLISIIKNINTKEFTWQSPKKIEVIKSEKENIEKRTKRREHVIKTKLRPFINPLKGSHNVDLIREILSSEFAMKHFVYKYKKNMASLKKVEDIANQKNESKTDGPTPTSNVEPSKFETFIFKRLLLPTLYGNMILKEEAYLAVALANKMAEKIEGQTMTKLIEFIVYQIFFINGENNKKKTKRKNELLNTSKDIYTLMGM